MQQMKICDGCKTENEIATKYCAKCGGANFSPKSVEKAESIQMATNASVSSYNNYTHEDASLDYQSSVGHFLQAIWFMICSAIFGSWGWSNYSSALQDAIRKCTSSYGSCDSPSFGLWILFWLIAVGFFIAAGRSGNTARDNLKRADALRP